MSLGILLEQVPDGDGPWWRMLASGLEWTLMVSALAWILAFALGSVVGVVRTTDRTWLVRLGNAYVELFRNIPLIVQFFLWFFVVPGVIPPVKRWVVSVDPLTYQLLTAVVCLGLFTSARLAGNIAPSPRGRRACR